MRHKTHSYSNVRSTLSFVERLQVTHAVWSLAVRRATQPSYAHNNSGASTLASARRVKCHVGPQKRKNVLRVSSCKERVVVV